MDTIVSYKILFYINLTLKDKALKNLLNMINIITIRF